MPSERSEIVSGVLDQQKKLWRNEQLLALVRSTIAAAVIRAGHEPDNALIAEIERVIRMMCEGTAEGAAKSFEGVMRDHGWIARP